MDKLFAEGEAEAVKEDGEDLKMVLLLVADHIDHLVYRVILETQFGSTYILRHIDGGTVGTQQQLLVESVFRQIRPDRTVFAAVESAGSESLLYLGFALQIGVGLVVDLIKRDTQAAVGLVKTGIDPLVHLRPQRAYFGIVRFPFTEHLLRLQHQRCLAFGGLFVLAGCHEFGYLRLVLLIETYVVVSDEVIPFLTGTLRRLTVAELQPCEHGFADMNTAVVDDIRLHHFPSVRLLDLSDRIT